MQQNEPGEAAIFASIAGNGAKMPIPLTKANRSKRIVISMSPHTAGCVEKAQELLEKDGYEVTVIDTGWADAEGVMEAIDITTVDGVLDVTLTGLADELLGGAQTLGLALLDAAAAAGVPLLLAPGGLDMVTFTSRDAIPPQWERRKFHEAAPNRILMRTDTADNARLGRLLADKVNQARGQVAVALPLRGLSDVGAPGEPFSSADITMALFGNLTTHLRRDIRLYDCNVSINDPAFAKLCVEALEVLMQKAARPA
jgi:uncharacterized protein (UPF0261 family)